MPDVCQTHDRKHAGTEFVAALLYKVPLTMQSALHTYLACSQPTLTQRADFRAAVRLQQRYGHWGDGCLLRFLSLWEYASSELGNGGC
jgi:hypothetical protein